jgi:AraC family transcriptional regulator of adaptative response / DNA-3-methyladenine glycosylase II
MPVRRPAVRQRQDHRHLLPADLSGAHEIRERLVLCTGRRSAGPAFVHVCAAGRNRELAFWRGAVSRALRLIEAGGLDDDDVEGLADRLGVGGRQLRRLFRQPVGAPPVAVAQTRRVLLAKQLIHETSLPMAEVALASGFNSIRRFNETFRTLFGRPPATLRRAHGGAKRKAGALSIRLAYRPPYD